MTLVSTPVGARHDAAPRPAAATGGHYRRRPLSLRAIGVLLKLVLALAFASPFLWVLITSVAEPGDVYRFPPKLTPDWVFSNYRRAWDAEPWLRFFGNTVLICACTVALALLTSVLAGFAFGMMRFPGRNVLFALCLSVMMIPSTVLLIPDYIIADDIGWLDTYWIQIVPWGASVFGIFLLRQFFLQLPVEIVEAAEMDGAGRLRILFSVALPLAVPALIVVGLNVLMASWNSFLWPFIMTQSPSVQPVEVGLATFYGADGTDWVGLSAAVAITTAPLLVIFFAVQRRFITGIAATGAGVRG